MPNKMLIIAANRGPVTLKAQQRPLLIHEFEDELKLCCPELAEAQRVLLCNRYVTHYARDIDALIALEAQNIVHQADYHLIEARLKDKGVFSLDDIENLSDNQRAAILNIINQKKTFGVYIPVPSSGGENGLAAELRASGAREKFQNACWVCWPGVDFVGSLDTDSAEVGLIADRVSKAMSTQEMGVAAVLFSKAEQHEYYDIIANSMLWPLMHATRSDLSYTANPIQLKALEKISNDDELTVEEAHLVDTLVENPPVDIAVSILNKCVTECVEKLNSIELKILDATLANPGLIFACERAQYIQKEANIDAGYLFEYTEEYERAWASYKKVNQYFARQIIAQVEAAESRGETAVLWLHDYPLLTTAADIKKKRPELVIKYFQHPPFPKAENFILMPYAGDLIQSLLQVDEIRFQILDYVKNFLNTVRYFIETGELGGWRVEGQKIIASDGRQVMVEHTPIGINYNDFSAHQEENETATSMIAAIEEAANISKLDEEGLRIASLVPIKPKIVFAGGRIDYIKGFVELLLAYKSLLEELSVFVNADVTKNSSKKNKTSLDRVYAIRSIQFILKVLPTYQSITAYNALWQRVNQLVSQIKILQTQLNLAPMTFYPYSLPMSGVIRLTRAADVVVVPVRSRDGFNRMVPEAFASWVGRSDKDSGQRGVMILGTGTGVYEYIDSLVLGVDSSAHEDQFVGQLKESLITAVTMPIAQQQQWVVAAQKIVRTDLPITGWIQHCLSLDGSVLANNKAWTFTGNGSTFFSNVTTSSLMGEPLAVVPEDMRVEEENSRFSMYETVGN